MRVLNDFREITGDKIISDLYKKARPLYGKRIIHINSTFYGGGVAEILNSLVPLMNDVGLDAGWRIIRGSPDFFAITKKFHNSLQGDPINLTEIKKKVYLQTNDDFSTYTHLNHDCVIIHDPQPLPMIKFYKKRQPWVWRCHIDLSHPNEKLWEFLKGFVLKYDIEIISNENYKADLPMEHKIIRPGIDPLTPKNMELSDRDNNLILSGDVILITSENNILVNALQRSSAVIIQKSIREGFGLTVTEALWKETPVVASNVGGIPLQISDGENGFLFEPNDNNGFAQKIVELIRKPELARKIGKNGRETVRQNFLVTRILKDYLDLLNKTIYNH